MRPKIPFMLLKIALLLLFAGMQFSCLAQVVIESPVQEKARPAKQAPQTISLDSLDISYGQVSKNDFLVNPGAVADSDASAIVLADIGSIRMEGSISGFRTVFTRTRRVRILRNSAMEDARIDLTFSSADNGGRKLRSLRACTYNLENGEVVRTPVSEADFFFEKVTGDRIEEKFAFPKVKEGSVIEFTYTIRSSDYFQLRPWRFQGKYPILFTQYSVRIPDNFDYLFLFQGNKPKQVQVTDTAATSILTGNMGYSVHMRSTLWEMRDVPALKEEPFTTTMSNYYSQVKFQLRSKPVAPTRSVNTLGTWIDLGQTLSDAEFFGAPLSAKNGWLKEPMRQLLAGVTDTLEKARKIFSFVRDHFETEGLGVIISPGSKLEDIFRGKKGSSAEINLLLIAMLRHEGIEADPVILSTRGNGLTYVNYPILDQFNNTIARVKIKNTAWYLDATEHKLGFGKLPLYCYNGHARVIAGSVDPLYFQPDSLVEREMTTVFMYNEGKDSMAATIQVDPGYYSSFDIRDEDSSFTGYLRSERKRFPFEFTADSTGGIDSLGNYDQPVHIHYTIRFAWENNDHVYFNPMLQASLPENYFKAAERSYPVELPFRSDRTFVLNMEVPEGYTVEELPKPVKVELNGKDGSFEYSIGLSGDHILFRSRIILARAVFDPEDYHFLRDFYAYVVKKQGELIVFKKKK